MQEDLETQNYKQRIEIAQLREVIYGQDYELQLLRSEKSDLLEEIRLLKVKAAKPLDQNPETNPKAFADNVKSAMVATGLAANIENLEFLWFSAYPQSVVDYHKTWLKSILDGEIIAERGAVITLSRAIGCPQAALYKGASATNEQSELKSKIRDWMDELDKILDGEDEHE